MQKQQKILINAATVKVSGGLIVALDIINTIQNSGKYRITLICPNTKSYRLLDVAKIYTPQYLIKSYLRLILDFFWIPQVIKTNKPELVISLGNLPAITNTKQILFSDNAFLSERNVFKLQLSLSSRLRHILRKRIFYKRIKYLQYIYVQTQLEKKRFLAHGLKSELIKVLPPLLPHHLTSKNKYNLPSCISKKTIRIACISNYFSHKNIEILKDVLDLAVHEGFLLQFIFTLNAKKIKGGKRIVKELNLHIQQHRAINIGNQPASNITSIIGQCDGVISPSLIETFGLNCLEAWHCGKPYFVSDLPWAHAVCKDAATYINPTDAKNILNKIKNTFSNQSKLGSIVESGSKELESWPNSSKLLLEIEKCFN